MAALRSALFALLFYPGTLLYVLAILAAVAVRRARRCSDCVHAWALFHYWLVRHVLGIRFEWDGEIPDGPYLIAVKHQAMVEAVDTLRFASSPVVVMKRELSHMPLWGKAARAYGVIGVDRDAGAAALREMMVEAKKAVAGGRPVIIFPEGTRVPVGEAPPLQSGLRRPLPRARAAGRAGRARQRHGCGRAASSSSRARSTSRSARSSRRASSATRSKRASTPRSTRSN